MLRAYQQAAVAAVGESLRALSAAGQPPRVVLVVPTGGGKTRIGAYMVARVVERQRRAVWGCHRGELVDQAFDALVAAGLNCGTVCATSGRPPNPFAPVQVGTFQSLIARGAQPPADLIVWDEAHHACGAKTWTEWAARYARVPMVGLTATPERGDGKGLGDMFGGLVVGARVQQLIDLGHLVPASLIRPGHTLKPGQIAQRPVDAYLKYAPGRRAIVFSPSVPLAAQHAADFRALGVSAVMVCGETPPDERRKAWAGLRSGSIRVVTNVYVATEGFDIQSIDCVILARNFGHVGGYLQSIGRGLRPSPDKNDCIVIDLQGISHREDIGHPHADRTYSLEGWGIGTGAPQDPRVVQRYCSCGQALDADALVCPVCGKTLEPPEQKVTGDELQPWQARMREDPEDKRVERLAKWLRQTQDKGHKEQAVGYRFKACYGSWPSAVMLRVAREIVAEQRAQEEAVQA